VFAVLTRVEVEAGSIDELAQLFEVTNRALVAGHGDWLGARFTANRDTNEVTVIARRRDVASFEQPRASDSYQGCTTLIQKVPRRGWGGGWLPVVKLAHADPSGWRSEVVALRRGTPHEMTELDASAVSSVPDHLRRFHGA
jgi:hypothetical protein